jgi:glycerol uptake facilitator-like aquaporin
VRLDEDEIEAELAKPTSVMETCLAEFLGTFVLMLTVGLNAVTDTSATAWSAAASLMSLIYSLGDVSGAHFNPAVTLGVMISGSRRLKAPEGQGQGQEGQEQGAMVNEESQQRKQLISMGRGFCYIFVQIFGAVAAGALYASYHYGGPESHTPMPIKTGKHITPAVACTGEMIFTALLVVFHCTHSAL